MKFKTFSFKNVTLTFKFNKESKYYLDGNDVIQLDNSWMHKQCFNVWDSLDNKRSKVTQNYDNVLIAISDIEFNQYKKSSDAWVERNLIKHNVKPTGLNIFNKFLK